jgi:hypothetical protein
MAAPVDIPIAELIPADTVLTDRQLLIHALQHIEAIDEKLTRFDALLDELGPLIERAKRRGGGLFAGR